MCTLVRILLTIQRQESLLKELKTTYPRPRHAMPRGPLVSRFHRPSQFASQFRDCVGALNLLRDFTTPSAPSVCVAILRLLRWRSKFTSRFRRFRDSVGAFNSLRDVTTPSLISICFATSRRRRSQFASRCRNSSNRVERSLAVSVDKTMTAESCDGKLSLKCDGEIRSDNKWNSQVFDRHQRAFSRATIVATILACVAPLQPVSSHTLPKR